MKKFSPTYHAENIYGVDPAFFTQIGVKVLVLDLDNTLASHDEPLPSEKTRKLLKALQDEGLRLYIVSNNKKKRVDKYMASLNIPYLAAAYKPLTGRIRRFLKKEKVDLGELMMVGDQILTDVFCANKLGVKILLTDKLVVSDQWTTRINRLIDEPIRKRLIRKNKLKEWNQHE